MNIKSLIFSSVVILFLNAEVFSQKKIEDERLKLAHEFAMSFKQGIISNEEIMKKYVVEGKYFKVDSVRRNGDQWMESLRKSLKMSDDQNIIALKYSDHQDEFAVSYHPVSEPKASMRRLKFWLVISKGKEINININDLYVIKDKTKEKGNLFILFNDENKIISFAALTIGFSTGLVMF